MAGRRRSRPRRWRSARTRSPPTPAARASTSTRTRARRCTAARQPKPRARTPRRSPRRGRSSPTGASPRSPTSSPAQGGHTEAVQNAFPGAAAEPWLVGVVRPLRPGAAAQLEAEPELRRRRQRASSGLVKGTFRGIEVLERGSSPRILSAYVLGSGGRTLASGDELAGRLGLDDTWAYFSVKQGAHAHGRARPQRAAPAVGERRGARHRRPPRAALRRGSRRPGRRRARSARDPPNSTPAGGVTAG